MSCFCLLVFSTYWDWMKMDGWTPSTEVLEEGQTSIPWKQLKKPPLLGSKSIQTMISFSINGHLGSLTLEGIRQAESYAFGHQRLTNGDSLAKLSRKICDDRERQSAM